MKQLLLAASVLISVSAFAQTKPTDSTKTQVRKDTVALPQPQSAPEYYYLVMPPSDWNELLKVMDASEYPANVITRYKKFILQNLQKVEPPKKEDKK